MAEAYEINGALAAREAFYAVACDPRRSVAVEACAGAGKTWMLVSRIVRALLLGAQPHEILAITFTRKAAGEMRQRLQEWLEQFAAATPQQLRQALLDRGVPQAEAAAQQEALRGLHARLLGAGRPVQIRTFHSWFAALLRNAPLATLEELGLPARHELVEDDARAIEKVWRRFHIRVAADADARRDYEASVAAHGRFLTLKALQAALDKRVEFMLADATGRVEESVQHWHRMFPEFADAAEPRAVLASPGPVWETLAIAARALGRASAPSYAAFGAQLEQALARADLDGIVQALLTQKLEPRKFSDRIAGLPQIRQAQDLAQRLCRASAQHQAWLHQQRLVRLTRVLVDEYAALKRDEGWVDMSDVEQAARRLLSDDVLAGFVQERLDARVRHLLVDEFQDTNPLQWQALHAWLSGYAGAGGAAPSVFIVGDPKQSIYRFRRAEPQVFQAAQRFVREGLGGDLLGCDHMRRNAPQLIEAVNAVMQQAQAAGQYAGFRPHSTASAGGGVLARLPVITRPERRREDTPDPLSDLPWRDSLAVPREVPEEHLLVLESRQAARWIATRIAGGTAPADVMVLARRRSRLAALEDELRLLRVPAQQPEKTDLCEAPEVQDVGALLDALVSPAHDLSLARALKSPLFGLADEQLVPLALRSRQRQAEGTPRPWLELLLREDWPQEPALAAAGERLRRWRQWVDRLPPHDALEAIYHDADVLARYAASVPAALREPVLAKLRALLGAALQVDGGRYVTPYALVRALRAGGLPGPAVAQVDAVRLLTVHGAKGLEADIVLLLDTDGAAPRPDTMGVLVDWPGEAAAPRRFAFLASESRPPACSVGALAAEFAAREREELNGLYVAMTRARRELVISSIEPHAPAAGSWWQRLQGWCAPIDLPPAGAVAVDGAVAITLPVVPAPEGAGRRPSTLLPRPAEETPESRLGQAVHRLLELRGATGAALDGAQVARIGRAFRLDAELLAQAQRMAGAIRTGQGAWAWDPAQLAWEGNEVELVHRGEVLRLDRLVRRRDGAWWVLDYKSGSRPETDPALLQQLRGYREAVSRLHPGEAVRAAFLTGDGRIVPLPDT
ncbi:MAG TPA: UvrD-helicase domain-containing protein [Ramlibacter sp.]|nr:UvrD-helicase domain-containing protein [Ramlibacter sp.]